MEVFELGPLTERDWDELLDGEREPFGPEGARLTWRPKDRHIVLRAPDGRVVAVAGALVADVAVERAGRFEVVGVGSVIVTRRLRGTGLMPRVLSHCSASRSEWAPIEPCSSAGPSSSRSIEGSLSPRSPGRFTPTSPTARSRCLRSRCGDHCTRASPSGRPDAWTCWGS